MYGLQGEPEAAHRHWDKAKELVPLLTAELFVIGYRKVMVDATLAERFGEGLTAAGIA